MSKKKTYRPPLAVLELGGEVLDMKLQKGDALSLTEVQKLYRTLSPGEVNEGLRWSRRILRQEGLLKKSTTGETQLLEVLDLQLGPEILAAVIEKDADTVSSAFEEGGVPVSCLPVDGGTLAFFSKDSREVGELTSAEFPYEEIELGQITFLEQSGSRLRSIAKSAGNSTTGFDCFLAEIPGEIVGLKIEKLYKLTTRDLIEYQAELIKVDSELGLVFGWAIICTLNNEEYFDKQGDHIPDDSMLEASADFMLNSRIGGEMHWKDEDGKKLNKGTVVFAFPLTAEVAKNFGIQTSVTGLMIAMRPAEDDMLQKFKDGEYKGFSIGGYRIPEHTEEVE